jgi:hypothetical protein
MAEREPLDGMVASELKKVGSQQGHLTVTLSNELVKLLSEQLYQSPLKAIEELVVNSYDADASWCRVGVSIESEPREGKIVVIDDGIGMDESGLTNLWQIGRSPKREEEYAKRLRRRQIGKFGIGKLATFTIANRLTHLTRTGNTILGVSIDFRSFEHDPTGSGKPIDLPIFRITDWTELQRHGGFAAACELAGVGAGALLSRKHSSWTIALLEDLKEKSSKIRVGRLRWVLSTAMPLRSDFRVFLNDGEVMSAKAAYESIVEFSVADLPEGRLKNLKANTGEDWGCTEGKLRCPSLPEGLSGSVLVTKRSLHAGKSEDLGRSNGFFVRVRGRVINENDALFGLEPLSHQTFNRFRAEIEADDLDAVVTAPREGVEESLERRLVSRALREIFLEARDRYQRILDLEDAAEGRKREGERNFVNPRLVERPIADVIGAPGAGEEGAEADESWFYLTVPQGVEIERLAEKLYSEERHFYRYSYDHEGSASRLVRFLADEGRFSINADHELVLAHADDGRSRSLLEDVVTAEVLLEVYLRESAVGAHIVGEVLERRDALLRSLAQDHPFSLDAIAQSLRDAVGEQYDLEVMLVSAVRSLGFVATHISGSGEPDGLARLREHPGGEQTITLEAKASSGIPSLSQLDLAGVADHKKRNGADGCLLLARGYPGMSRGEDSSVATRASDLAISCWTVDQLAQVVELAEKRHITARQVLDVVLSAFAPDDVSEAVNQMVNLPTWTEVDLYRAVRTALIDLEGRLPDAARTVDLVAAEVSRDAGFAGIEMKAVYEALRQLAAASKGGLSLRDRTIRMHVSPEELDRRVAVLTTDQAQPRRSGRFGRSD